MKKLLVALMAICIAFSAFSFTVLAEETTGEAAADVTTDETVETEAGEKKAVESLVGAFYLQGESGSMLDANGDVVPSDYDYQIADIMAKQLSEEEFRASTQVTIDNNGDLEDTMKQIENALRRKANE